MAAGKGKADGTGVPGHGGDGAEVAEDSTQVVEYAAAIDVAKGSGMVCTRVPGSRADRRRQATWPVQATFTAVTALMDHLRCQGIQRLVLESTSDYWRIWLRHEVAVRREALEIEGGARPPRWAVAAVRWELGAA